MSHETDLLWAHARGQLSAQEANRVQAHLAQCPQCALKLEEARAAQRLIGAVPLEPLSPQRWGQVDLKVAAAAERELARSGWLGWLVGPPAFAAAALAAAVLLLFVLWPPSPPPAPALGGKIPLAAPAVATQVPLAAPAPVPPVAVVPSAAPQPVRITLAKDADRVGSAEALLADEAVPPGATVSTRNKGELWLSLPDGSRAALMAQSRLTLFEVAPQRVRLELQQGVVLVEAVARAGRAFEVKAGEVELRISGTRFLVERIDGKVLVAVSEGAVEVAAGERLYTVDEGRSLTLSEGRPAEGKLSMRHTEELARLAPVVARSTAKPSPSRGEEAPQEWAPYQEPATPPAAAAAAAVPAPSDPDSEFAAYPGLAQPSSPPPPVVALALPAAPMEQEEPDAGRTVLERLLALDINSPFPPLGMSMAEHRARQLRNLADKGLCAEVLPRADAWLEAYPQPAAPGWEDWRRGVLLTKARCLAKLGRPEEAEALRQLAR